MFVQAYATAAVILLLAIVLGRAICSLAGARERWWAAPAVGFAALIVLEAVAIKLPGRAVTAVVVAGLALVAAVAVLLRRKTEAISAGDGLVAGLSVVAASLPFVANGRIGLPGVSVDNDTSWHLLWAESLRSPIMARLWPPSVGYPLGPHSVVAAVGTLTGSSLDMAFTGLLVATVGITAVTATGVVSDQPLWRRTVVGVLCSLAYLVAGYYAEGAFKETIMAVLVLGFAVHLEQASTVWNRAGSATRWWLVAPAVLLMAAAVYTYSYVGLVWFAGSLVLWLLVSLIRHPSAAAAWVSSRRWRSDLAWTAGAIAFGVILVLPVIGSVLSFFQGYGLSASGSGAITVSNLGNLSGPLSPYEMLGIWVSPDFRVFPTNVFHAGELSALALAAVAYGAYCNVRRGRLMLPASALAFWLIWWHTNQTQSPYVSAKALAIAAPLVMALALSGLLGRRGGSRRTRAVRLVAAGVFCAFAAASTYQLLRHQPVQAPESARELAGFERRIGSSPVLFLGSDEYATWQLRPAPVSALFPAAPSRNAASLNPNKPYVTGQPLDFDSVAPGDLEHFQYVITGSGSYSSQAPSNFRLLSTGRLYDLWQRTGPTVPRQVIEPPSAPGAILNCRSAVGKRLAAAHGEASVMATPITVNGPNFLPAGGSATAQLPLPPGRWEISLQYFSAFDFDVTAQDGRWRMPAYLGRQGPYFNVGAVSGHGPGAPVTLLFKAQRPSVFTGTFDDLFTYVPAIAATRLPDSRQIVPLRRACGRYVDWYRTT